MLKENPISRKEGWGFCILSIKGKGIRMAQYAAEPVKRLDPYTERLPYRRQNPIQLSKSHHPGEMEALNRTKPLD
jgi:hypothetical protein